MYLSESFRIWRKRRYLTAALLVLALAGSGAALSTLPRTYQANSSVILLASRTAASPYGGNPYLSFSPSLTLAADAVSRELMGPGTVLSLAARGFSASYTVALAPYTTTTTGSVLLVTVSGSDKTNVERTLSAVTRGISVKLAQLQGKVTRRRLRQAAKPQEAVTPERAPDPVGHLLDSRRGRAERRRTPDLSPAHGQSGRGPTADG